MVLGATWKRYRNLQKQLSFFFHKTWNELCYMNWFALSKKIWHGFVYEQVREELESMGCQIKTGCEVRSVSRFNGGRSLVPYISTCIWLFMSISSDICRVTHISICLFAFVGYFFIISMPAIIVFNLYYILMFDT